MALSKKKFSDLPLDAITLSEDDALKHQMNLVQNWKKKDETWIFRYGFGIVAAFSTVSSIFINNHFRSKFKLRELGRMSSYLPVVIIPSLITGVFHQQFVVTDILLQKACPVCLEVRSASLQAVFSTIFPTIIAPLAALPFAIRYNTYNVPLITKEPVKVANMLIRHTKPIRNILLGMMAVQGLGAALVTYYEQNSFINIQNKLFELEKRLDETVHSFS